MLVVKHQQAIHEEAIEPGVDGFGALAQSKTQSAAGSTEQGNTVEGVDSDGKIGLERPGGQRPKVLGDQMDKSPGTCFPGSL